MGDLAQGGRGADRIEDTFHSLARVAAHVIHGAESASVTLVGADGAMSTLANTSALAQDMDLVQLRCNQGPCLQAATAAQFTAILVSDLQTETRWPAITAAGSAATARSVLSASLFAGPRPGVGDVQQAVGSLNIYASAAGAFSGSERDPVLLLALYAAMAVAATKAIGDADPKIAQLDAAIANRSVIGQAQGILM
ncbi:MAG: hypothetical protein ABI474_09750, partial [Actinomycetota bacterium]